MHNETSTLIRVEQLTEEEKTFVLGDLKFDALYPTDVLYGTQPPGMPIQMKIQRGDTELRARVDVLWTQSQGGGCDCFIMLGATYFGGTTTSDFEVGDIICFDSAMPHLAQNIVRRWYERVKQQPPWKEKLAALAQADSAAFKAIDDRLLQHKRKSETHRAQHQQEWDKYTKIARARSRKFEKRMRAASPLPEVLRFLVK